MTHPILFGVATLLLTPQVALRAADVPLTFHDPKPQRYELTARASQIDPRARPHPEIDFVFEKDGKPADVENARSIPASIRWANWSSGSWETARNCSSA